MTGLAESGLETERRALLGAARTFAEREIAPYVADYDREERFPVEIVRKAADLGWIGAVLPEAYGGQELDWTTFALLIEELSRVCHIVGLAISMPSVSRVSVSSGRPAMR